MSILGIDLDKTNLDHDNNFRKMSSNYWTKILSWHNKFEKIKAFKKDISKN